MLQELIITDGTTTVGSLIRIYLFCLIKKYGSAFKPHCATPFSIEINKEVGDTRRGGVAGVRGDGRGNKDNSLAIFLSNSVRATGNYYIYLVVLVKGVVVGEHDLSKYSIVKRTII